MEALAAQLSDVERMVSFVNLPADPTITVVRGETWQPVLDAIGPREAGKWVGRLTFAHFGNPAEAIEAAGLLAEFEPPLPNEAYLHYRAGLAEVPALQQYERGR